MGGKPYNTDQDLFREIAAIYAEASGLFHNLVEAARLNPATDFQRRDLRSLSFDNADLRGFDFTESDLRGTRIRCAARLDATTKLTSTKLDPEDRLALESLGGPWPPAENPRGLNDQLQRVSKPERRLPPVSNLKTSPARTALDMNGESLQANTHLLETVATDYDAQGAVSDIRPGPGVTSRLNAWSDSLLADHGVFRVFWDNWAEVVPDKLYRSNHPTPSRLRAAARRYGLKTLINLRGHRLCGSDALSRDTAERLGLIHIDMAFQSRGAPERDRILRFADIYAKLQTPALMHCKSGADRAGLAAGLAILFEGGTATQALNQLSWRFGHFRRSRTGILDAFFLLYATEAEGQIPFLTWVRDHYDEAALRHAFLASGLSSFITDQILHRE